MNDEQSDDLPALHALGLLEGAELAQFADELARSPGLRLGVADLRGAAAALALLAPEAEPPAALRERVLSSASARLPAAHPARSRAPSFPSWIPWLAAACLGVAAAWSGRLYLSARAENASLREQQRVSELALGEARSHLDSESRSAAKSRIEIAKLDARLRAEGDLAHFKIATLASMLGNSPAAVAVAVWNPAREEGVLEVSRLPAIAAEKDYQLWVIDSQYPSPVSGGVFAVDPATGEAHVVFRTGKPVRSIAKFAVSLERKGGAPEPEGPIVLISQ
jgi:anti-sigma-K factor RskA